MNHATLYEHIDREVQNQRERVQSARNDPPETNVAQLRERRRREHLREVESTRNAHLAAAIATRASHD